MYLGSTDVIPVLTMPHEAVRAAHHRWGDLLLGSSGTPYHELLPAVLGQRVTGREATGQWSRLVRMYGPPAPGPNEGLRLPPDPETLSRLPYYELHSLGIEKRRAETLRTVARHANWLIADHVGAADDLTQSLTRIPGVGVWTAAVAGGPAFGDPDALQVGDYHLKNTVSWALRGVIRGTDDQMCRDLAVYAGQRHRVVRWLELDGWRAPRRGPGRRNLSVARL